MSAKKKSPGSLQSYGQAAYRRAVLKVSPFLTRRGMGRIALTLLEPLVKQGGDIAVIEQLYKTCNRLGMTSRAVEYRAKILRGRATRAARAKGLDRPVQNLLRALAGLESMKLAAPLPATKRLSRLMADDDGLRALAAASEPVIAEFPNSALLIYVRAVALAKTDQIDEAVALVRKSTRAATSDQALGRADRTARLNHLGNAWRVVDMIARDKMAWAGGVEDVEVAVNAAEGQTAEPDAAVAEHGPAHQEAMLQRREQTRYLAGCRRQFDQAQSLREKLIAIKAMLRQGLRRLPSYHRSYEAARKAYEEVRPLWTGMLAASENAVDPALVRKGAALKTVRLLIQILQMARELGYPDDVSALEQTLLAVGRRQEARTAVWTIASVLVDDDPDEFREVTTQMVMAAGTPQKSHEVRDLFAWAARARRHDLAHAYYETTAENDRRAYAMIHYAKILQRDGAFDQALRLVRDITGWVMATPKAFCPHRHWNLMKRTIELEFLADSAKWLKSEPQPTNPKGLVFVGARNAGQLTKYPMAVLLELKKEGWAVVPLVEGVMPIEPTGDPRIDRFMGCLLQDLRLNPDVRDSFEPIKGYNPDVAHGVLTWGDINLSQPLWEEAAIHRRRFNIDYSCPSLQKHLGRLAEWTRLHATVLANARRTLRRRRLRAAFLTPHQARLPDAVNRLYCARHGDAAKFYCVHISNGYENYFVNFARLTSTKAAARNMTAHPELRSAGFPVPSQFLAWYEARKDYGAEMLEQVRDTTKVRRSTRTTAEPPAEALACMQKLRDWRAGGGKVACAFGKVVCDMSAPIDGGPAHRNMKDWINHTIESVRGSNTLLLIKPHPHELRNEIATFLTEYFVDLIEVDVPENVIITGQDWFDLHDLDGLVDLGLLYNGTTAVELGLMNIPAVLCSNFAPVDYPVGHMTPRNRAHYRKLVRFESPITVAPDLAERSAAWIHYMSGDLVTIPYRYHARPTTNKVVMPPRWFEEDIKTYLKRGDPSVVRLARRISDLPARTAATRRTVAPSTRPSAAPDPDSRPAAFRKAAPAAE